MSGAQPDEEGADSAHLAFLIFPVAPPQFPLQRLEGTGQRKGTVLEIHRFRYLEPG